MEKKLFIELVSQLSSGNEQNIIATLNNIKEIGESQLIPYIADVFINENMKEASALAYKILCDLKLQTAADSMVEVLKDPKYNAKLKELLSCCWQSRVNYIAHLEYFIDQVFSAPFEIAFEAFTVIENIDGKVSFERKGEIINHLNNGMGTCQQDTLVLAMDIEKIVEEYEEP